MVRIRLGHDRVFRHHIQGAGRTFENAGHELRGSFADFSGERHAPCLFKFFLIGFNGHVLVARVNIRQTAQIAGALDVILSTQRIDTAARHAHIAQKHLQIGETENIMHARDVLSDAHCPDDRHRFCLPHNFGGFVELCLRYARDLFGLFGRVAHHGFVKLVKILGALGDKVRVFPAII